MDTSRQYCSFFVAGFCFGVRVECVQEVLRYQQMTKVPLAPEVVEGLINLRGQIVTAIDMRRKLLLPERDLSCFPMNVVLTEECAGGGVVSLLVDEIGDVLEVEHAQYEAPPATLDPALRPLISGVYKLDEGLLLELDTPRTIGACSDGRAA